jgi:uncharacterized membrane protein YgaE (UPF0421/DUF939 family)
MEKTLRITLLIKMIIGFTVAYLIGVFFDLNYAYTAGVIAVLSLALTKEAVLKSALKRSLASFIGIGLGALFFWLFDYKIYTLIIIVILLTLILYSLKLEIGIVLALVLISQEYLGASPEYALNAIYILLIGVTVAIILNFYSPTPIKTLEKNEINIDSQISDIFAHLSKEESVDFSELKKLISVAKNDYILAKENRSFEDVEKRLSYIGMREYQVLVLERISGILVTLPTSIHKDKLNQFLAGFVNNIGKADYASNLLLRLETLHQEYEKLELPKTRKEFENRAELFHVLSELRSFLEAKIQYHHQYDK